MAAWSDTATTAAARSATTAAARSATTAAGTIHRLPPTQVAPDTFVVHDHLVDHLGRTVPCNLLLIRGAEPVVVDTGAADHGVDGLFSLIEPAELRWIIVSDAQHVGNLAALLGAAPHAVVVAEARAAQRLAPARCRPVVHGARVDVGDRRLVLDVPPVYDSPASLGAYDPTTGVWWSADTFATEVDQPVVDVADLEPQRWAESITAMAHEIAPWLALVDAARFAATVEAVEALGASTIVGTHTPVIGPRTIDAAWSVVRSLPSRGRRR